MIQQFLNHPLSFSRKTASKWKVIYFMSVFPALFFVIFKPFGLVNTSGDLIFEIALAGFGVVTGLVIILFYVLLPYLIPSFFETFNVGKAILFFSIFFLVLSFANYLYKVAWGGVYNFSLSGFLLVLKRTLLFGVIPFLITIVWHQNQVLKQHLATAQIINKRTQQTNEEFVLYADNQREMVKILYQHLLFIESADNYIYIHFKEKANIEKKLIRTTLTKTLEKIEANFVVRCHRSFIINLKQIKHATGNSRGLLLELHHTSQKIPVSRSYVQTISEKLALL